MTLRRVHARWLPVVLLAAAVVFLLGRYGLRAPAESGGAPPSAASESPAPPTEALPPPANLRVVADENSETGYRVIIGPFPGWKTLPNQ